MLRSAMGGALLLVSPAEAAVWKRREGTFWRTDDPSGRVFVWNCQGSDLRPSLSQYERIAPYE
jgi:hypothetical protein